MTLCCVRKPETPEGPTQALGEHTNSTQKDTQGLNAGPSCCEVTVPPCLSTYLSIWIQVWTHSNTWKLHVTHCQVGLHMTFEGQSYLIYKTHDLAQKNY